MREVDSWIREWIWNKSAAWRSRTIIAFPEGDFDQLFGYGTWKHLDKVNEDGADVRHIEIAWFGVHSEFHGARTASGARCADVLYATVEQDARSHDLSTAAMPMTLECHRDNEKGRRFWIRQGYRDLQEVALLLPDATAQKYRRMVR